MSISSLWSKFRHRSNPAGNNKNAVSSVSFPDSEDVTSLIKNDTGLEIIPRKSGNVEKKTNTELLNQAFNRLIDKLGGINENLSRQINQHEQLTARLEKLPDFFQPLTGSIENQRRLVESLIEQLKADHASQQQFVDAVEKIPASTEKQTEAVIEMKQKVSEAAEHSEQMSHNFDRFNGTLDRLDKDTSSQTDCILQMSRTFAESGRSFQQMMTRHNKRLMWVWAISITICFFAVASLITIVILLLNR